MIARIRKSIEEKEEGFTLIELLVVMIIIGILAAIAIPTFLNQRKNGYNSASKTDLGNVALAFESAAVDAGGDFTKLWPVAANNAVGASVWDGTTGTLSANLSGVEFKGSQNVVVKQAIASTATEFCVYAYNTSNPGVYWVYNKARGGLQSSSVTTVPVAADCPNP